MLSPSSLTRSLNHTVGPDLRVCILLTPQSKLIAYASAPPNEDLVKILLGLASEAWRDAQSNADTEDSMISKDDEFVRLDCEVRPRLTYSIFLHGAMS